jgi:5-hydroxyisourate hydrolase
MGKLVDSCENTKKSPAGISQNGGQQGRSGMMGRLTTHVLDLTTGKPAAALAIELWRHDGDHSAHLKTVQTNGDGRADGPLLEGAELELGTYELRFMAGDYLKRQATDLPEPLFLDMVPIRFGVADPAAHYHVPLLLSAHGYSTYRGS